MVLVEMAFGIDYMRNVLGEIALTSLGSVTADQALAAGTSPREVWHSLCDEMGVSDFLRMGGSSAVAVPPKNL